MDGCGLPRFSCPWPTPPPTAVADVVVSQINQHRASADYRDLVVSDVLTAVADAHTAHMVANGRVCQFLVSAVQHAWAADDAAASCLAVRRSGPPDEVARTLVEEMLADAHQRLHIFTRGFNFIGVAVQVGVANVNYLTCLFARLPLRR